MGGGEAEEKAEEKAVVVNSIEQENDLRHFLKLVRPDWSKPRRHGHSDIQRVIKKLKTIGVLDINDLMKRVLANKINEDLTSAGYSRFSRETIDGIKKQTSFLRALEHLTEASVRQHGRFAPVPQMLSKKNILGSHPSRSTGSLPPPSLSQTRPESQMESDRRRKGREAFQSVDSSVNTPTHDRDDWFWDDQRSISSAMFGFFADDDLGPVAERGKDHADSFGKPRRLRHTVDNYAPTTCSPMRSCASTPAMSTQVSTQLPSLMGSQMAWTPRAWSASAGSYGATVRLAASRPRGGLQPEELAANIQALQKDAKGGSETYDRVAAQGDEELENMDQEESFTAQGGSSIQVVRIAAFYAKLGLTPKRVLTLLMDDQKAVGLVRHELDLLVGQRMQEQGAQMRQMLRSPPWKSIKTKTDEHGDAMLKEQVAMQAKVQLQKVMDREGSMPPWDRHNTTMRRHVTKNIRCRLTEELQRDIAARGQVQQQCMNIKRNLTMMGNSKRELGALQKKLLESCPDMEEVKVTKDLGLTLNFG